MALVYAPAGGIALAVPFLLEMLRSPETLGKADIAVLVAKLADASSPLEAYTGAEDEMSRLVCAALADQGRNFETELREGRDWVRATRDAVSSGLDLLFPIRRTRSLRSERRLHGRSPGFPKEPGIPLLSWSIFCGPKQKRT